MRSRGSLSLLWSIFDETNLFSTFLNPEGASGCEVEELYGPVRSGFVSAPAVQRHIVFDGALLHGTMPGRGREAERITFLVNVPPPGPSGSRTP